MCVDQVMWVRYKKIVASLLLEDSRCQQLNCIQRRQIVYLKRK